MIYHIDQSDIDFLRQDAAQYKIDAPSLNPNFKEMMKLRRREMTPRARKRNASIRPGTAWLYPFQWERAYTAFIRRQLKPYSDIIKDAVRDNLSTWVEEFQVDGLKKDSFVTDWAKVMGTLRLQQRKHFGEGNSGNMIASILTIGQGVDSFNGKQWNKFATLAIGSAFFSGDAWVNETLDIWSGANFTLIQSLTDEYIKKVNTIVISGIQDGANTTTIMKQFRKMDKNMKGPRATLLARDQVGKLNGVLTKGRQQEAGIDKYKWVTASDERVRATHKRMSNSLNRWDNASVYIPAGQSQWISRPSSMQGAIPGSQIQCRCIAIPYIDEMTEEIDREIALEAA